MRSLIVLAILATASFAISKPVTVESPSDLRQGVTTQPSSAKLKGADEQFPDPWPSSPTYNITPTLTATVIARMDASSPPLTHNIRHPTSLAFRDVSQPILGSGLPDAEESSDTVFPTASSGSEQMTPTLIPQLKSGAPSSTPTRHLRYSNTEAVPDTDLLLAKLPRPSSGWVTTSPVLGSIVFVTSPTTDAGPDLTSSSSTVTPSTISSADVVIIFTVLTTASQSTSALAGSPTPSDDPSRKKSQHFPPGAIGGVVAGAILLLVSVAIAFCIWRKRATKTNADAHSAARPYYTAQESALAGEHAVPSPPPLLPHEAQPQDKPEVLHEESSLVPHYHDPSSSPHVLPLSSPEPIGPAIDIINHERQLSGQHTSSNNNALNAGELQGPRDEPPLTVVDPSALSGLVERITRAILLDSRLGHAMTVAEPAGDTGEAPPRYQESRSNDGWH